MSDIHAYTRKETLVRYTLIKNLLFVTTKPQQNVTVKRIIFIVLQEINNNI